MNNKIVVPLILFIYIGLVLPTVASNNVKSIPSPEKGAVLFKQSKCLTCHGVNTFQKKDTKINSLATLEKQVRVCDGRLNVHWFDDEIKHVVSYLNKSYYRFSSREKIMDNNDTTKK